MGLLDEPWDESGPEEGSLEALVAQVKGVGQVKVQRGGSKPPKIKDRSPTLRLEAFEDEVLVQLPVGLVTAIENSGVSVRDALLFYCRDKGITTHVPRWLKQLEGDLLE